MIPESWIVSTGDKEAEDCLVRELGVSKVIARLLANRGALTPQEAETFLNAPMAALEDPLRMKGMAAAVERVLKARAANEKVVVFGDYDVDGVTATAVTLKFLREIGMNAEYYIPERATEGYGLSESAIAKIIETTGANLIITVDNGINANSAVDFAAKAGVEVIITDHHKPGETIPAAVAVLNPNQEDCEYPCKALAGVGIAFKLCMAVRSRLAENGEDRNNLPNLKRYLDLVAIGSVADCSPLTGENRLLALHGIRELSATARPGIRALKEVSSINGGRLSTRDIAFSLAPRLNAAGRMGRADTGLDLLLTEDINKGRTLARLLDETNKRRQELQRGMVEEAKALAEKEFNPESDRILILGSSSWAHGVAGIVASKLSEEYSVPAAVVCFENGVGKGSARSFPSFDITAALSRVSNHLVKFGGHRVAAGFTVNKEDFEDFRAGLKQLAAENICGADLGPKLMIDCEMDPCAINKELLQNISALEPFGEGNPAPLFLSRGVKFNSVSYMGQENRSVRLSLGCGLDALGFSMAGRFTGASSPGARYDIVYHAEISVWKDVERIQLRLVDAVPST